MTLKETGLDIINEEIHFIFCDITVNLGLFWLILNTYKYWCLKGTEFLKFTKVRLQIYVLLLIWKIPMDTLGQGVRRYQIQPPGLAVGRITSLLFKNVNSVWLNLCLINWFFLIFITKYPQIRIYSGSAYIFSTMPLLHLPFLFC